MKILIVDDHPLVLQSIATALENAGHDVTIAVNKEKARIDLKEYYDVLLLDYNMQTCKGTDLLSEDIVNPGKAVLISGINDPDVILYILDTTAINAFISKQLDPDQLPLAIEQIHELPGDFDYIWLDNRQQYVKATEAYEKNQILTPKEREVFMLLRQGMLDKQIADHLNRSIHTIRVQIRSIKRKRGSHRRLADNDFF
ncbi:response regulator transcription factor [Methylomarinum vadi]|uniref:response regulator transcription factor n=1 Tax=Methylomarinum vadi TaxID=438855 RepID=UPI0004DF8EBF|nr:response regulator transcription factor [Methylomarinum vadi]